MSDRLLKNDFIYSFFLAGGGYIAWLYERGDQVFLRVIRDMKSEVYVHFHLEDRSQIDVIAKTFNLLGFNEFPVFQRYSEMPDDLRLKLNEQFRIYENTQKQAELPKPTLELAEGPNKKDVQKERD